MKLNVDKLGKVAITVDENPWIISKSYDKLVVVYDEYGTGISYISRLPVPKSKQITLDNRTYWIPLGRANAQISIGTFTILDSIYSLPLARADYKGPYLIDGIAYFWVGEDGNVHGGLYQSVNIKGETGAQGPRGPQGSPGTPGPRGADGYSAYQVAMRELYGPNQADWLMNIDEWLETLKGEKGDDGDPLTFEDLTQEQIAQLKGAKGDKGDKGDSAYHVAMQTLYPDSANWPSPATWLESLVGPQGPTGPVGRDGTPGKRGDVIQKIEYNDETNQFVFTVRSYNTTGAQVYTLVTYNVQMPDDFGQGGGPGQTIYIREQVLNLNVGTLADAKAYAIDTENRNTYYQWLLVDTDTIEENGQTLTVPVRKVLWHIPHSAYYEYIDAIGNIIVSEDFEGNPV